MNTPKPTPGPGLPRWLAPVLTVLMALQLGLLWIQGGLLNRQREEIRGLREEIQSLADLIDESLGTTPQEEMNPARTRHLPRRIQRTSLQAPEDEDKAAQELRASRQSAQEATARAAETQRKLSIEENRKLAEAQQRREAEQHRWSRLAGLGFALGLVLLTIRAWIRRR